MGIFEGFAEGLAAAVDDIRHQVVEQGYFGQQTTGNIELPQVQAPTIEAPQAMTGDIQPPEPASYSPADMSPAIGQTIDASYSVVEPAIEPTTWAQAAQGIEAPQIEPPAPSQEMER